MAQESAWLAPLYGPLDITMNALTLSVPIEEYNIGTLESLWDFGLF